MLQGDVAAFKEYTLEDAKGGRAVPDPQQPKLEKGPKKEQPQQRQTQEQPQKAQQQEQKPAASAPKQPSGMRLHSGDQTLCVTLFFVMSGRL